MGESLLAGSALAAFLAGAVAFFAPCCSSIMLPSYLAAATAGTRRWRLLPLTGLYVAGVATVVWPITIGAAGLASLVNRYHTEMFIAGGAMMIVVGVATLQGWMWSSPLAGPRPGTTAGSVYLMGAFAGAATSCCAPVLAGAVTIAGVSGSWWVGAVLGGFYLLGMITPLLVASAGIGRVQRLLRDPPLTLRLAGRSLRTTRLRLAASVLFILIGAFMVVIALAGEASTAPGFQQAFGRWLNERASWIADNTPFVLGWALMLVFVAAVVAVVWRSVSNHRLEEESQ